MTPQKLLRGSTGMALALAGSLTLLPKTAAHAQSQEVARGLEGTWRVEVTLRDCNTGAALAAPFRSLLSFARGTTKAANSKKPKEKL